MQMIWRCMSPVHVWSTRCSVGSQCPATLGTLATTRCSSFTILAEEIRRRGRSGTVLHRKIWELVVLNCILFPFDCNYVIVWPVNSANLRLATLQVAGSTPFLKVSQWRPGPSSSLMNPCETQHTTFLRQDVIELPFHRNTRTLPKSMCRLYVKVG